MKIVARMRPAAQMKYHKLRVNPVDRNMTLSGNSMYSTYYLGRQPIVNADQQLVAYELLFRSGATNHASFEDSVVATMSVIKHTFVDLGSSQVLGNRLGFINVDEQVLMHGPLLECLPKDQVVLEVLETVEPSDEVLARLQELKQQGFRLAMDDVTELDEARKQWLPYMDVVKVELLGRTPEQIHELVLQLSGFKGTLLAEKVDSVEQFEFCKSLGFTWFQGYFFARPSVLSASKADSSHAVLLKLMGLLLRDVDIDELEQALKMAPDIVLMLIKMSSSAANGYNGVGVSSIREAIMLLGRAKIKRWAMLLMFCMEQSGVASTNNPLLELAALRGRTMELLVMASPHHEIHGLPEQAFMVGILSLIDVLLHQDKTLILAGLPVEDNIRQAVLGALTPLGRLLEGVIALEQSKPCLLDEYDLPTLAVVQQQAMEWVSSLWH